MKQILKPNAELDILTAQELRAEIEHLLSGYLRPPEEARPEGGVALSAGGAGTIDLYTVPVGMLFYLTRVYVTAGNATFQAPLAGAGGISILRFSGSLGDEIDGTGFTSLPQVATWSRNNGPLFRDGERIGIGIAGGPASGQAFARAMGFLAPLSADLPWSDGSDLT